MTAEQNNLSNVDGIPWQTVIWPVAGMILFALYIVLSYTVTPNSDNTVPLLEAQSILHGNIFLRGWWVSPDTFYWTDLPFYVVAEAFAGLRPALMHVVPAFIFTLTVLTGTYLINERVPSRVRWLAIGVFLVVVGAPVNYAAGFLLLGPLHVGTLLFVIIALRLAIQGTRPAVVGSAVILACAAASDPLAYVVGVAPLAILAIRAYILDRHSPLVGRWAIVAGGASVGAVILSHAWVSLGYHVAPASPPFSFATGADFSRNIGLFVPVLLGLFGGNFLGQSLDLEILPTLIRLLLAVAVVGLAARNARRFLLRTESTDSLGDALLIAALLDAAAFLFSDLPIDMGAGRYLTPFMIMTTLAVCRSLSRINIPVRMTRLVGALGALWLGISVATASPAAPPPSQPLAFWLAAHNLTQGFGPYWDANIITAEDAGFVRVSPVVNYGSGVVPYLWLTNSLRYRSAGRFFFIDQPSQPWGGLSLSSAEKTWGPPSEVRHIDTYTVLIWNKSVRFPGPGYAP